MCCCINHPGKGIGCEQGNGGCSHNCTTWGQGSFVCHCPDGLRISTTERKSCEGKAKTVTILTLCSSCLVLTILAPRIGRFMDKSAPSPSVPCLTQVVCQKTFPSIFPCCQSIASFVSLAFSFPVPSP